MSEKLPTITYVDEKPTIVPDLPLPPEGMVYRRKLDGVTFSGELYLGIRFFSKTGQMLKNPVKEKPEDYELISLEEVHT